MKCLKLSGGGTFKVKISTFISSSREAQNVEDSCLLSHSEEVSGFAFLVLCQS